MIAVIPQKNWFVTFPPLPVVTIFEIKNEQDISDFRTVCRGLHDACIEEIKQDGSDLIITFYTAWEKRIVITYGGVIEARNIENI